MKNIDIKKYWPPKILSYAKHKNHSSNKFKLSPKNYEKFMFLLGYWLGDGLKTSENVGIVYGSNQKEEYEYLNILFSELFTSYSNIIKKNGTISFNSIYLKRWIDDVFENDIIWEIAKQYPEAFIAGIISSDGAIYNEKIFDKDKKEIKIEIYNTNKSWIDKIIQLLTYIQINTMYKIRTKESINSNSKSKFKANHDQYTICISGKSSTYILAYKILPYLFKQKQIETCKTFISTYENMYKKSTLPFIECFNSIQGEGTHIGVPMTFVRFAGCNLRCTICDTKNSWCVKQSQLKLIPDIINIIEDVSNVKKICLTGGEVLLYPKKMIFLCSYLKARGYWIQLETNGTKGNLQTRPIFNIVDCVDMDMKSPCTGSVSNPKYIQYLSKKDYVKVLVNTKKDLTFAKNINKHCKKVGCSLILQPITDQVDFTRTKLLDKLKWLTEISLKDPELKDVRVLPQLHSLIWGLCSGV